MIYCDNTIDSIRDSTRELYKNFYKSFILQLWMQFSILISLTISISFLIIIARYNSNSYIREIWITDELLAPTLFTQCLIMKYPFKTLYIRGKVNQLSNIILLDCGFLCKILKRIWTHKYSTNVQKIYHIMQSICLKSKEDIKNIIIEIQAEK